MVIRYFGVCTQHESLSDSRGSKKVRGESSKNWQKPCDLNSLGIRPPWKMDTILPQHQICNLIIKHCTQKLAKNISSYGWNIWIFAPKIWNLRMCNLVLAQKIKLNWIFVDDFIIFIIFGTKIQIFLWFWFTDFWRKNSNIFVDYFTISFDFAAEILIFELASGFLQERNFSDQNCATAPVCLEMPKTFNTTCNK